MVSYASLRMGLDRFQNYWSKFQAFLIAYIALKEGFPLWILIAIVCVGLPFMYFDMKFLFPRELKYITQNTKPIMELHEKLDRIEKRLKGD